MLRYTSFTLAGRFVRNRAYIEAYSRHRECSIHTGQLLHTPPVCLWSEIGAQAIQINVGSRDPTVLPRTSFGPITKFCVIHVCRPPQVDLVIPPPRISRLHSQPAITSYNFSWRSVRFQCRNPSHASALCTFPGLFEIIES